MKGFAFLRKTNPSYAECGLNRRCLQSKEIPMVDENPVVSLRKRKPGLRRYSRALQPTGLCELEVVQLRRVLTMRDLPNDQRTCGCPWSHGSASLLSLSSFVSSCLGVKCQSERVIFAASTETHRMLLMTYSGV